ncbi:hypothetical protein Q9S36_37790 [Microbacterium sp. ARD31]|uniref:FtsX-like permease family protein n=1 Tax=Microbacterium sp. ARD31 TaxID=2962576 RepID=UPI0028823575|nr:FtsX-like permease family protein [Microbacterium sp. ARD31]MDT0185953.1 hypothetical protein [Microbacterium sp. ARD31]
MALPRPHWPTVRGRLLADRGLLLLVTTVVALTVALVGAVSPVTERSADRAMAAAVADAGPRGTVVATLPEWYDDPAGKVLDPSTATQVRQDADLARSTMPRELAAVLGPGVTTVTTPPLQLLDAGPGRYLRLAFLDTAHGGPAVTYTRGGPPSGAPGRRVAVEVAVSAAVATTLDLEVDDRIPARDEHGRSVEVAVSGVFAPEDPGEEAWQVEPQLLHPASSTAGDEPRTAGAALVTAESLPVLRLAVPGDALSRRLVLAPVPEAVRWRHAAGVEQTIAALQSRAGTGFGETTWDSLLATVLRDGRARVAAARGQAEVVLVGLLAVVLLVLVLAAQLLAQRRAATLTGARERGAGLSGIGVELGVESLLVALVGAAAGLAAVRLAAGSVGWAWSAPVLVVAVLAPVALGVATARGRVARAPANRSTRRARVRAAQLQRVVLELAVLVAAVLSLVALRQRGVADGGDLTGTSAVTWIAVSAAVLLVRLVPVAVQAALRRTGQTTSGVPLFVAARLARSGPSALPQVVATVVVVVAVSAATFGAALAATLRDGQAAGALSVVGGDARLDARPDPTVAEAASEVARAAGVRAAAAARVEDGVRVSARGGSAFVRLVVVDAPAYEQVLAASDLPDAPRLARLRSADGPVPALVLGGPEGLRDDPSLRWQDARVPLQVVGAAPAVGAADPVVVVDVEALTAAGASVPPDSVWAVGPGAAAALHAVGEAVPGGAVVTYADELAQRRGAALPSAVLALAWVSCVLLAVAGLLGVALAVAADAPGRATALGRLRALGTSDRDLRLTLLGELATPVLASAVVGLAVGVGCAHAALGSLSLQRLTLAPGATDPVVPWWAVLPVVVLVGGAAALALLEWRRLRRTPLSQLLRS